MGWYRVIYGQSNTCTGRRGVGYYLDMYSIGMMMLVLLCQKEDKSILFRDGEEIYLKRDTRALREFFAEDWGDEVLIIKFIEIDLI